MIRKISGSDRALFIDMASKFYHSEAVLHPIPDEYFQKTFDELMRSEAYLECYIFQHNNVPAGYVLLSKSYSCEAGGGVVWIEDLFILPQYRGLGLGTEFFSWLEENIPAARYRLEIEPDNKRARALYTRLGFTELPYAQMIKEQK